MSAPTITRTDRSAGFRRARSSAGTRRTVRAAGVVAAVGLTLLFAGCSADEGTQSDSALSSGAEEQAAGADSGSASAADGTELISSDTTIDTTDTDRIRTARVTLEVPELESALLRVRALASGLDGLVQEESSSFGHDAADAASVITVRVPVDALDTAIDQLSQFGEVLDQHTRSKDVTTTIADLDSRVASQEASVARLRTLLTEAGSVKDVIAVESQLSSREADLESLQAQARAVKDKAALSTLVLTLQLPEAGGADHGSGFLAGLSRGWHGLGIVTVAALTVLGVLLPTLLVLAPIAAGSWLLYRRFGRGRPTHTPAAAPPSSS